MEFLCFMSTSLTVISARVCRWVLIWCANSGHLVLSTIHTYDSLSTIDRLLDIGVEQIVFHGETQPHIDGMLNRIHSRGVKAGVALKPSTPLSEVEYVLEKCDTVLLMLINPGYAFVKGEKQVTYGKRKIEDLRQMIDRRGLPAKIEVDGRISPDNIREYGAGAVDIFVTGSTCIDRKNMAESLRALSKLRETVIGG